jgi:hypothetical protein
MGYIPGQSRMDRMKGAQSVLGEPGGGQGHWVDMHSEGVLTGLTCPIFQNRDRFLLLKRTCCRPEPPFHDASTITYPVEIMGCNPDVAAHRFNMNSPVNRAGVTPRAP